MVTEMEFAHRKETSACSSRRNPAGKISRSAQADTLRGRRRAARAAHPDRAHRARGKTRHRRHRAAARQVLQDRRRVLDEHAGALRSRNRRRRARATDVHEQGRWRCGRCGAMRFAYCTLRPRLCSAPLRKGCALRCVRGTSPVIPGRAFFRREPGIHNHGLGLWIPGPRQGRVPESRLQGRLTPPSCDAAPARPRSAPPRRR
jgi:hypothetical protein